MKVMISMRIYLIDDIVVGGPSHGFDRLLVNDHRPRHTRLVSVNLGGENGSTRQLVTT